MLPSGRLSVNAAAEALLVDSSTLVFAPSEPPITDHARKGRMSENVCIAVVPEDHPRPEAILYVLDPRPILMSLRVMRAPAGRVDIAFICDCFAAFCPEGFCITVKGGESSPDTNNHFRLVGFGDVITVEFRARWYPERASGSGDQINVHTIPPASTASSETQNTAASSGSNTHDAGTGGSSRSRTGGPSPPVGMQATLDTTARLLHVPGCQRCVPNGPRSAAEKIMPLPAACTAGEAPCDTIRTAQLRRYQETFEALLGCGHRCSVYTTVLYALAAFGSGFLLWGIGTLFPYLLYACSVSRGPTMRTGAFMLLAGILLLPSVYAGAPADEPPVTSHSHGADLIGAHCSAVNRPVATPCRNPGRVCVHEPLDGDRPHARFLQYASASEADSVMHPRDPETTAPWALTTLLEESIAGPDSEAYMLAATLLDTLFEYEEERAAAAALTSKPNKLELLAYLPPPTFNLSLDAARLPHSSELLPRLLQTWPRTWLLPSGWKDANLPQSSTASLKTLTPWASLFKPQESSDLSFSLYTDGSANLALNHSGYAVVILAHAGRDSALLGALGDRILGAAATPWAPEGPPALHAEYIALAVSLLWCIQMRTVMQHLCCSICFDCTAAGWSADGSWQTSGPTSEKVHHLYTVARAIPGINLHFRHVKGHSNDPWNDLADHIAKTASSGSQTWPTPPNDLCSAVMQEDISWLAPELDARLCHAVPITDGVITWGAPVHGDALLLPEQLVPTSKAPAGANNANEGFRLAAATINVQGLRTKCQYIEDQLDQREIHVAFLQETKLPGGTHTSQNYLRLHTDAESHWGVGIWIHRKLGVLTTGRKGLTVDEHDVEILHKTPRLLALLLNVNSLKIGLLSGHCPHSSRVDERLAFLRQLTAVLPRFKRSSLFLCGVDLNGRVPPNYADVSGSLEFGEPDEVGWRLASALADNGMWIPSMYSQIHCGDSTTYIHPSGQPHRIDYLLVGGKASIEYARSATDPTFDNGSPQDDHILLTLQVAGSLDASSRLCRLLRPSYDRDKLLSEDGRARIKYALSTFPQPSWEVGPDQHCRQLEEFVRAELDAHFTKPPAQSRASYIPDSVWRLRDAKLHFKQIVRHRSQLWEAMRCRAFFQWHTGQDYGVVALLRKQCLLYELAAAAIRVVTASIKQKIAQAKNAFLYRVAGENHQGAAKILQRVKKAGIGGKRNRPHFPPVTAATPSHIGSARGH